MFAYPGPVITNNKWCRALHLHFLWSSIKPHSGSICCVKHHRTVPSSSFIYRWRETVVFSPVSRGGPPWNVSVNDPTPPLPLPCSGFMGLPSTPRGIFPCSPADVVYNGWRALKRSLCSLNLHESPSGRESALPSSGFAVAGRVEKVTDLSASVFTAGVTAAMLCCIDDQPARQPRNLMQAASDISIPRAKPKYCCSVLVCASSSNCCREVVWSYLAGYAVPVPFVCCVLFCGALLCLLHTRTDTGYS